MLDPERMPAERVVVHFEFVGVPAAKAHFWMVLDGDAPDLCVVDPGFGDDMVVRSRPGPIGAMWMGDRTLADLVTEGAMTVTGLPRFVRELPAWIGTSVFGDIDRAVGRVRRSPVATP